MFQAGPSGGGEALLGRVEHYRACPTDQLEAAYGQMVALARVARAEAAAILAVMDERESWRTEGVTSMAAWVAATESLKMSSATEEVDIARALARLPHCAAVAGAGELSHDQLVPLCRFVEPETDERWAGLAPGYSPADLWRQARRAQRVSSADARDKHGARSVRWHTEAVTGTLRLFGWLPADAGDIVTKALTKLATEAPALPDGTYDPFEARCADALLALASAELGEASESPRATLVCHVQADSLRHNGDGYIQTTDGTPLAPEVGRRIACDSKLCIVLDDPEGVTLGVGRAQRLVPTWLSRIVAQRDGGACRFSGCGRRLGTQLHHLVHWADGGPTDLSNIVTTCSFHHHLVHERGWSMGGDPNRPDGLWIRRPDGSAFQPSKTRLGNDVRESVFGDRTPGGPPGWGGP